MKKGRKEGWKRRNKAPSEEEWREKKETRKNNKQSNKLILNLKCIIQKKSEKRGNKTKQSDVRG
jgi:hypothetical protein